MKARHIHLVMLALAGAAILVSCAAPHRPSPPPIVSLRQKFQAGQEVRILWIGNSYSFGVPRQVERMARAVGGKVCCEQVTYSGWTLARHARNPQTLQAIHSRPWDAVVLQEQSRFPSTRLLRLWKSRPALATLIREIRMTHAQPLLYQTWAYRTGDPKKFRDDFSRMNQRLRDGYRLLGCAFDVPVVPVGDAWELQMGADGGAQLFQADGRHPSRQGDKLSSKTFMTSLFGMKSDTL